MDWKLPDSGPFPWETATVELAKPQAAGYFNKPGTYVHTISSVPLENLGEYTVSPSRAGQSYIVGYSPEKIARTWV